MNRTELLELDRLMRSGDAGGAQALIETAIRRNVAEDESQVAFDNQQEYFLVERRGHDLGATRNFNGAVIVEQFNADLNKLLRLCGIASTADELRSDYEQMIAGAASRYDENSTLYDARPDAELDAAGVSPAIQALTCLRLLSRQADGPTAFTQLRTPAYDWLCHVTNARLHDLLLDYPALAHPRIVYPLHESEPGKMASCPLPLLHWVSFVASITLPTHQAAPHGRERAGFEWATHPATELALATKAQQLLGFKESAGADKLPVSVHVLRYAQSVLPELPAARLTSFLRLDRFRKEHHDAQAAAAAASIVKTGKTSRYESLFARKAGREAILSLVHMAFHDAWAPSKSDLVTEKARDDLRGEFRRSQAFKPIDFQPTVIGQAGQVLYIPGPSVGMQVVKRQCGARLRSISNELVQWGFYADTDQAAYAVAKAMLDVAHDHSANSFLNQATEALAFEDAQDFLLSLEALGVTRELYAAMLENARTRLGTALSALSQASSALITQKSMSQVIKGSGATKFMTFKRPETATQVREASAKFGAQCEQEGTVLTFKDSDSFDYVVYHYCMKMDPVERPILGATPAQGTASVRATPAPRRGSL